MALSLVYLKWSDSLSLILITIISYIDYDYHDDKNNDYDGYSYYYIVNFHLLLLLLIFLLFLVLLYATPRNIRPRGLFLKSPETFRAHFGCHNSFYIFATPRV